MEVVPSRYRILEQLGAGEYGVVSRAIDTETGQTVAIKKVRISDRSEDRYPAFEEIVALQELKSKYVPQLYGYWKEGEPTKYLYIVQELITGDCIPNLHIEPEAGSIDDPKYRTWLWTVLDQLLDALIFIEAKGWEHNDISCDNVMWRREPVDGSSIAIIDLGSATRISSGRSGDNILAILVEATLRSFPTPAWQKLYEVSRARLYDKHDNHSLTDLKALYLELSAE